MSTLTGMGVVRAVFGRVVAAGQRAVRHAGYERDSAMLVVKSLVAASGAWAIANIALALPSPAFAPFTAVLMVQATVYRSVRRAGQYVLAVVLGVGIEGGLGFAIGPNFGTFILLALLALLLAQWRRLEEQGTQVTTAAFFAYATFITATSVGQRLSELGDIVLLVLIGAGCGVLTNLLYPPLHYSSVAANIDRLTASLAELLEDMRAALTAGAPAAEEADDWLYRARRFEETTVQIRETVANAEESVRLNPRQLLGGNPTGFTGYRVVVDACERSGGQLVAIAHGLSHVSESAQDETDSAHRQFLDSYGQLVAAAAEAVRDIGYVDQLRNYGDVDALQEHIQHGRQRYEQLATQLEHGDLDLAGQWPLYGGLLVDAERLIDEFEKARRLLVNEHHAAHT